MQFLKANTGVKVVIGPFVDVGDGFTPETGVTLGGADEAELLKHDAASVTDISSNTWAAITNADGWYNITLSSTDTNTEGLLEIIVQDDSVCLPVHARFMVLAEAAYDSMFVAKDSGYMDVDAKLISGSSTAADNVEANIGNLDASIATVDTVVDAIKAKTDNLPADPADDSDIDSQLATIDTVVDAIKAKTDNLPADPADDSDIDAQLATIVADTNEIQTDLTDGGRLDLLIDAIKAKTDLLPSEPAKNVALSNFTFLMVLSSDHVTPATGKTITSQISKDGAAFANTTNSVAEIANGFYKIDLTQTEMNANIVALKFTETDCDQRSIVMVTST